MTRPNNEDWNATTAEQQHVVIGRPPAGALASQRPAPPEQLPPAEVARPAEPVAPTVTAPASATTAQAAAAVAEPRAAPAGRTLAAGGFGDPGGPGPGGPAGGAPVPAGNGHRPSGRMPPLHIGSHLISDEALARLAVPASGSGMILGVTPTQQLVTMRFFRAEPTRIALVGGVWAGQFLVFRALGLGARVAIVTGEPAAWHGFGERVTGRDDLVRIFRAEFPLSLPSSPHFPSLIVYDLGVSGPAAPLQLGPWQTQLTILRHLDGAGVPSIQDCDVAMLQRLHRDEAELAGAALRLPAHTVSLLQTIGIEMAALWGSGARRFVMLAQTEVERAHTGVPRR
jgi:hypothetical protein